MDALETKMKERKNKKQKTKNKKQTEEMLTF